MTNSFPLTQSELIARTYARAASYDATDFMLRDLLMIDLTFPNDYDATDIDHDAAHAECDSILASYDNDSERMPNLFHALNDHMRSTLHETLNYLLLLNRESITTMRLNASLCPLHAHDYAICFDDASCRTDADDDEFAYTRECDSIRLIHPSHDT